jgi:hypothetical protein
MIPLLGRWLPLITGINLFSALIRVLNVAADVFDVLFYNYFRFHFFFTLLSIIFTKNAQL